MAPNFEKKMITFSRSDRKYSSGRLHAERHAYSGKFCYNREKGIGDIGIPSDAHRAYNEYEFGVSSEFRKPRIQEF